MKKNFEFPEGKIHPLVLNGPESWNGWVHGFSPRFFQTGSGDRHPLNPGYENIHGGSLKHRDAFLFSLGIEPCDLFLMKQVHGKDVLELTSESAKNFPKTPPAGDAVITCVPNHVIGVVTADCVPVLIYDPVTPAVGAVHAGRKGTALRILSATVMRMAERFGSRPEKLSVLMGPAIAGCCYEVDEECTRPFREGFKEADRFISDSDNGAFMLDLIEANRQDAISAGVVEENIVLSGECTACNLDRWYSYRKEGQTGRMVAVAMLKSRD